MPCAQCYYYCRTQQFVRSTDRCVGCDTPGHTPTINRATERGERGYPRSVVHTAVAPGVPLCPASRLRLLLLLLSLYLAHSPLCQKGRRLFLCFFYCLTTAVYPLRNLLIASGCPCPRLMVCGCVSVSVKTLAGVRGSGKI